MRSIKLNKVKYNNKISIYAERLELSEAVSNDV